MQTAGWTAYPERPLRLGSIRSMLYSYVPGLTVSHPARQFARLTLWRVRLTLCLLRGLISDFTNHG
jgi:hypothetical protein